MTVTVMKATFEKLQPRVVNYRDYKYFENCRFRADLLSELSKANIEENEEGLSGFLNTCKRILDLHAPCKQKYARGNHMSFMNRAVQKWKSAVDKGKLLGALLTDLSKACDCLARELLLAKLHAYGFSIAALRLIHSYLTNRQQRTKINMSLSSWEEIIFGVPQGSILGPLLLNIFVCDLFFIMKETDFSSYADDNTSRTADTIEEVTKLLECDSAMLFKWFSGNQMKAIISNCHLLINKKDEVVINLGETEIKNGDYEKLLGIEVDTKLNFNKHLNNIISKASRTVFFSFFF